MNASLTPRKARTPPGRITRARTTQVHRAIGDGLALRGHVSDPHDTAVGAANVVLRTSRRRPSGSGRRSRPQAPRPTNRAAVLLDPRGTPRVVHSRLLLVRLEQNRAYAGTVTSSSNVSNSANATGAPDSVCATTSMDPATIVLTNFGFSLPAGASVQGIEVDAKVGQLPPPRPDRSPLL